jgi:hypothetical protein
MRIFKERPESLSVLLVTGAVPKAEKKQLSDHNTATAGPPLTS